jgi:hypothetical protein
MEMQSQTQTHSQMQTQNQFQTQSMDNLPTPPPITIKYPSSPNWHFAGNDADCLSSAYNVIMQNEAWSILKNFKEKSFMLSQDPIIINLITKVNDAYGGGHSGASLAYTMSIMEYIAQNGFESFVRCRTS